MARDPRLETFTRGMPPVALKQFEEMLDGLEAGQDDSQVGLVVLTKRTVKVMIADRAFLLDAGTAVETTDEDRAGMASDLCRMFPEGTTPEPFTAAEAGHVIGLITSDVWARLPDIATILVKFEREGDIVSMATCGIGFTSRPGAFPVDNNRTLH